MQSITRTPVGPLGVAVLSLLEERPMHPYEISFTMRRRHMDHSIKVKWGSLYHVVDALLRAGLIEASETGREGRRPERTVYRLTEAGRETFETRLAEMIAVPQRDYSTFEAGLSMIHHLDPPAAVARLRDRTALLRDEIAKTRQVLELVAPRVPRIYIIEVYRTLAAQEAELEWVTELIGEIERGDLAWQGGCASEIEEGY